MTRKLRTAIGVLALSFFCFGFLNPDYLEWSSSKKLSLNDFKGKVPANASSSVSLATIITYESRQVPGNPPQMTILNLIDRNNSWIKDKNQEVVDLQQIKFDRSELNVRMIRKTMAEMNKKGVVDKEKYISVVTKKVQEFNRKQNNSVFLEAQPHLIKIMQKDIRDSLEIYKAYAK